MDARVFITKETMNKAEKPLSNREKGKLRLKKLYEIAENGKLMDAKTKTQVGLLCGYNENEKALACSWTTYLINKGVLIERLSGRNKYTNLPEYEYSLAGKKAEAPAKKETPIAQYQDASGITLQVKKNDIVITFDKLDVNKATEITLAILGA